MEWEFWNNKPIVVNRPFVLDGLPEIRITQSGIDAYGVIELIKSIYDWPYDKRSYSSKNLIWQHGWMPTYCVEYNPEIEIITGVTHNPNNYYLVGKTCEEAYIKSRGFNNVKAIGVPIVYVPYKKIKRIPRSLLVMPVHSIDSTFHDWDFKQYVLDIQAIKKYFDVIAICIHPSCIKKRYWIDDFEKAGFEIIIGTTGMDLNGLLRIQYLMSSFEYVTTNGFGSHIPYAAYFGAKISVYGKAAEYKEEEFLGDAFWRENHHLLSDSIKLLSVKYLEKHYPFLFYDNPIEAKILKDWADDELGEMNRLKKEEIFEIFGWKISNVIKHYFFTYNGIKCILSKCTPNWVKQIVKQAIQ